jgi:hypothetical protein
VDEAARDEQVNEQNIDVDAMMSKSTVADDLRVRVSGEFPSEVAADPPNPRD